MAREIYELRLNCNESTNRVNDLKECDGIGDKTASNVYEFIHKGEESGEKE